MRISDWSSDVCSSDLPPNKQAPDPRRSPARCFAPVAIVAGIGRNAAGIEQLDPRPAKRRRAVGHERQRSEEHTSELQSLMRISYAVFCLKKKKRKTRAV